MAALTHPRKDFGEEIPGARKTNNNAVAFGALAAMLQSDVDYPSDLVAAKLTEIRRDNEWGSLKQRLADLQEQGAGPGLAIAWRVLYRSVAASAASTHVKPSTSTRGRRWLVSPQNAYIFGHVYKEVLARIEREMESMPLDASWIDINQTELFSPNVFAQRSNTYSHFLAGGEAMSAINAYRAVAPDRLEEATPTTVAQWLDRETQLQQVVMGLVRPNGRTLEAVLSRAKRDVFNDCLPGSDYRPHMMAVVRDYGHDDPAVGYPNRDLQWWLDAYVEQLVVGNADTTTASGLICYTSARQHLENPLATGALLAHEAYSNILHDAAFDPFNVSSARKTTTTPDASPAEGDGEGVDSVVPKKVMPPTRFEHLTRTTTGNTPPYRSGDITEVDLCELVPFRGIQYGNWANQSERQEMLNLAYDAMSDLALALGVPTQYLALPLGEEGDDKRLGLALGARGKGGNASAHYESAQHVINLTKTSGGGALAHEWMHAYDHKVASTLRLGCATASEIAGNPVNEFVRTLHAFVPEARAQHATNTHQRKHELMLAALLPPDTEAVLAEVSGSPGAWEVFAGAVSKTIEDWARVDRPVLEYACSGTRLTLSVIQTSMENGLVTHGVPQSTAHALAEAWDRATIGHVWIKLDRTLRKDPALSQRHSSYLSQAQLLNGGKEKGYWTTPTELFARAGSAVVFDRLKTHGITNGFLAESSNPDSFDPEHHRGNPNPSGVEREVFAEAFAATILAQIWAEQPEVQVEEPVVADTYGQLSLF